MREIYLDNSATTQVAEPAAKAVYEMLVSCYGNPSSLHRKGLEAENRITAARKSLAKLLDCDPAEITFTSGRKPTTWLCWVWRRPVRARASGL